MRTKIALAFAAAAATLLLLEGLARTVPFMAPPPPRLLTPKYLKYVKDLQRPLFDAEHVRKSGYFPSRRPRPEMPKPPGTVRVFCLGESTVLLPGFVESVADRLSRLNPGARWEVINGGVGAVDIGYVEKFADEALSYSPDLLVVYFGNNVAVHIPSTNAALLAAQNVLQGSAFMRFALSRAQVPVTDPESDDRRLTAALARIALKARERGTPLILCVPSRNLQFPVFARDLPNSPDARRAAGKAYLAFEAGRWPAAKAELSGLVALAPGVAVFHYKLGKALLESGDCSDARRQLETSLDLDSNHSRMPERTMRTLRAFTRQFRLPAADLDAALAQTAPCGVPGYDSFLDGMHPLSRTYLRLADAVLTAARGDVALMRRIRAVAPARPAPSSLAAPPATDPQERLTWLLNDAWTGACTMKEPELAVGALQAAWRLGPGAAARALDGVIDEASNGGPSELQAYAADCDRNRTRGLMWVYAGMATRRLGETSAARRYFERAALSREPAVLSALDVQLGIGELSAGHSREAARLRAEALARDPAAGASPWFFALD